MDYWLHRIKGGDHAFEYAKPLLFKHNYLSIGWTDLSTEKFLKEVQSDKSGMPVIEKAMKHLGWGLPKNRWNLYRFIKEMKKGDIVLVPLSYEFSLFEIEDDVVLTNETIDINIFQDWNGKQATRRDNNYLYNENDQRIDLGFYRKVRPILIHIPRSQYAEQDLISRMKIRQTNAKITGIQKSIEDSRKAYIEKKPINLKEKIVEETAPKVLALVEKWTDADKFENLVECYLKSLGAKTVTPRKNESKTEDGDADVVGYFENIKTVIMVQVKKHTETTNAWAIEQIKAYNKNHQYDDYFTQMWVISSCKKFSEKAINEAEISGVRLITGIEFAKMILDAGLEGLTL